MSIEIDWMQILGVSTVVVSTYVITGHKWTGFILAGVASYGYKTTFGKPKKAVEKQSPVQPVEPAGPTDPVRRKVVAFDFDKCLMMKHWWGTYRTQPIENINPERTDFAHKNIGVLLMDLFNKSDSKANNLTINIAVASFGRGDVIRKAIASALPAEYAERVFVTTPGDYEGYQDGQSMGNKNTQLQAISHKFNTEIQDIIFFDDDKRNIAEAKEMGINAVVAAPFNESYQDLIQQHLDA